MPVTIQTPAHVKGVPLPSQRHLTHRTMAGRATYAFGDVGAVVKVDEIGEIVNLHPFNRFTGSSAFTYRL